MVEILYLGSIFCALLTIYVLLFKANSYRSYADYILSLFFIFTIAGITIYLMVITGFINKVPYLYKTAGPLNYLTPVLSYLYVRAVLFNEKTFNYKDLVHLFPFFIIFISYIPYYSLPIAEKAIIVKAISNNLNLAQTYKFGIIPEKYFFLFIPVQTSFYLILQLLLIVNFKKSNQHIEVQNQINDVLKWIKTFTLASTIFVVGYILLIIGAFNSSTFFQSTSAIIIPGLALSISFFIVSSYLLINPYVLSGLPFIKYQKIESSIDELAISLVPFIETDYTKEIKLIDDYFIAHKKYLVQELNMSMVAVSLNIPVRDISYIINNFYGVRFTDFVNKYRIDNFISKLDVTNLDIFTMESLAKESGFGNKSSFYRAFKKIHNLTPLEYIEQFKEKQIINRV